MTRRPHLRLATAAAVGSAVLLLAAAPALAERADRTKPIVVEADREGVIDLQRRVVTYAGNAVVTQGTMVLRAERIEMRETADGYRAATAIGAPGRPASWRQKRDGVDEFVEGSADRIEFDGRADTLRFIGNAAVRRLRDGNVVDEITGRAVLWDNTQEVFRVEGGAATAANPSGRVRAVLSPRVEGEAPPPRQPQAPLAPSRSLPPAGSDGGRR
jgi:lipopolysaccharide export system protein LptA